VLSCPTLRGGFYRKDEFRYDPDSDSFVCPARKKLEAYTKSLLRGLKKINYANRMACRDCPLRLKCAGHTFRSVARMENEAVDKTMDEPGRVPDARPGEGSG
jgi:hypothetical protein